MIQADGKYASIITGLSYVNEAPYTAKHNYYIYINDFDKYCFKLIDTLISHWFSSINCV